MVDEYPLRCISRHKKDLQGLVHGEGYSAGCRCFECVRSEFRRLNAKPSQVSYKKLKKETRSPRKWKIHIGTLDKTIYI